LGSNSLQFSNVSLVVYLPVYRPQWIGSLDSVKIGQANLQWNHQALHPPEKTFSPGLGRHLEYQLTARKQPYVLDETNQSRTSRRSGVTSSGLATQAGRHQKAAGASWKPAANPSTYPWVDQGRLDHDPSISQGAQSMHLAINVHATHLEAELEDMSTRTGSSHEVDESNPALQPTNGRQNRMLRMRMSGAS